MQNKTLPSEAILKGLCTQVMGQTAVYLPAVDSTNTFCKEHADLPHGTVCYTDWQQAGRGRMGRNWSCANGEALAMTLVLDAVSQPALLPLLAGLAVTNALEGLTGEPFWLKWPNDSICKDRKVCGILCESFFCDSGQKVLIGIGINLTQTAESFARLQLPHAASLKMLTGKPFLFGETAAAVLNAFEPLYESYCRDGFSAVQTNYAARCINIGRQVRVIGGNTETIGTAIGIGEDGSLQVQTDAGLQSLIAGEVSVRGLYGYV